MDLQQALALFRDGQTDEAVRAYEEVLRDDPGNAAALIQLGSLRLVQGDATAAESLLRRAADASPDSAEAHANLAAALQRQERFDEAITHYERALSLDPTLVDARFAFAVCLQTARRTEQAEACYEALLQVQPDHAEANYGLGMLLAQLGRRIEAIRQFRATLAADPDFAEAHYELGRLLSLTETPRRALASFRRALEIDPAYTQARLGLGETLRQLGQRDGATSAFRAVLTADPDNTEAHNGLALLCQDEQPRIHAVERDTFAAIGPNADLEAKIAAIELLKNKNQDSAALEAARRLAEEYPDSADCARMLGLTLAETGAIHEGLAECRRALALAPDRPELGYHVVLLTKVRLDDPVLQVLESAADDAASLQPGCLCMVHFALAKAYGDLGEPDRGFAHLLQGNALYRANIEYDEASILERMERIRHVFSAELIEAHENIGNPSAVPVFIVGMPRSGTTLVEQILASHSAVFGGGEQSGVAELLMNASAARFGGTRFPEVIWTMSDDGIRQLGTRYVAMLRTLAPEASHITDKMPTNFPYVGLIHIMLPNARIIHVRRDPVDTCLSCFASLFSELQPFAYDLAELGRFYRGYERLMAHWRTVLPDKTMLEVEYESLVDDFDAQARRIVEYCDLEWDPACREFHKTSRVIRTASLTQVRQPIYRNSVRRWRPEAAQLQPLLDALDGR